MTVGELKTQFSDVLKRVQAGEEIDISYGKSKEVVARLVPKKKQITGKRKIGFLDRKSKIVFSSGFEMTTEEFLGR